MHSLYGWSNLKKQILFYKVVFALAQDRPQAPHATRNLFRCSCLLQRKHIVQINLDRGLFEAPRIRVTPINYVQRFRICPLLLLSVLTTETTTPPFTNRISSCIFFGGRFRHLKGKGYTHQQHALRKTPWCARPVRPWGARPGRPSELQDNKKCHESS